MRSSSTSGSSSTAPVSLSDWALSAEPGLPAAISGPGRGYTVDPDAPAYLVAGDETAIAAITQVLDAVPRCRCPCRCASKWPTPTAASRCRSIPARPSSGAISPPGAPPGDALVAAVRDVELADGTRVWAAGEAAAVQRIRRHLFDDRGLPRVQTSVRGYWKHGPRRRRRTTTRDIRRTSRSGVRRISAELREGEVVKPLELFFDLVFVLGFTQCTALMAAQPTLGGDRPGDARARNAVVGLGRLRVVDERDRARRGLGSNRRFSRRLPRCSLLPSAYRTPSATAALLFVVAYGMVRAGQIALFLIASRDDPGLRRSVVSLAISSAIGVGLLTGASFLAGGAQEALWGIAILVDWGGPALFGMRGWRLVPGHFAERHSLVIILALG